MSKKTIFITLTSAIALDGQLVMPGEVVEVTEKEARNLLHRGKGILENQPAPAPADLNKLTVDALRELASDAGITNVRDLKKADLITALEALQADEAE